MLNVLLLVSVATNLVATLVSAAVGHCDGDGGGVEEDDESGGEEEKTKKKGENDSVCFFNFFFFFFCALDPRQISHGQRRVLMQPHNGAILRPAQGVFLTIRTRTGEEHTAKWESVSDICACK